MFCYYNRPVARFFNGEVRSNEETDQMRPEGHVYGARGFKTELSSKFAIGGTRFERVSVSRQGGSGGVNCWQYNFICLIFLPWDRFILLIF